VVSVDNPPWRVARPDQPAGDQPEAVFAQRSHRKVDQHFAAYVNQLIRTLLALGYPHPNRLKDPLRAYVHPFARVVIPEQPAVCGERVHPHLLEGLEGKVHVLPLPLAHPVQIQGAIGGVCKQHVHLHLSLISAHQLLAVAVVLRYLERHLQQGAKPICNGCQINFRCFTFAQAVGIGLNQITTS